MNCTKNATLHLANPDDPQHPHILKVNWRSVRDRLDVTEQEISEAMEGGGDLTQLVKSKLLSNSEQNPLIHGMKLLEEAEKELEHENLEEARNKLTIAIQHLHAAAEDGNHDAMYELVKVFNKYPNIQVAGGDYYNEEKMREYLKKAAETIPRASFEYGLILTEENKDGRVYFAKCCELLEDKELTNSLENSPIPLSLSDELLRYESKFRTQYYLDGSDLTRLEKIVGDAKVDSRFRSKAYHLMGLHYKSHGFGSDSDRYLECLHQAYQLEKNDPASNLTATIELLKGLRKNSKNASKDTANSNVYSNHAERNTKPDVAIPTKS